MHTLTKNSHFWWTRVRPEYLKTASAAGSCSRSFPSVFQRSPPTKLEGVDKHQSIMWTDAITTSTAHQTSTHIMCASFSPGWLEDLGATANHRRDGEWFLFVPTPSIDGNPPQQPAPAMILRLEIAGKTFLITAVITDFRGVFPYLRHPRLVAHEVGATGSRDAFLPPGWQRALHTKQYVRCGTR